MSDASYLIAHNIDFDYPVALCEMIRCGFATEKLKSLKRICTMKSSTDFCKLPSARGYKYPKLVELYYKLFNKTLIETHNSKTDAAMCMLCFKELFNKQIIKF